MIPSRCPFLDPNAHLSLAQVDEERRLWLLLTRGAGLTAEDNARLWYLSRRRVRPQYDPAPKGAA